MAGMELAVGVELTHGADPPIADRARGKSDGGAGGEPCMVGVTGGEARDGERGTTS
jgi:hypothetical protein